MSDAPGGGRGAGPVARLVQALARLPGIGEKTATRLAYHILRGSPEEARALAQSIAEVKSQLRLCSRCCDFTASELCPLCADPRRDEALLCVVGEPQDVLAIERAGGYRGRYHVLHGVLSPLDGVGPDDLRIAELVRRCAEPGSAVREVILATNPSVEGETTAVYLAKLLKPLGMRTTRIATGVPLGGELEYADRFTLARAIDARRDM